MILTSIANDPRMPFEQKQKMFVNMGQTALQNAEAQYKLAVGEARLEDSETRKDDVIRKEKQAAYRQSNPTDKEGKEMRTQLNKLDQDEAKALADPVKSAGREKEIKAQYEEKRQAVRDRYSKGGTSAPAKKTSQFEEGKIYVDGNGNKAKYSQGRWIPQ
jgi:hypothetical protein